MYKLGKRVHVTAATDVGSRLYYNFPFGPA